MSSILARMDRPVGRPCQTFELAYDVKQIRRVARKLAVLLHRLWITREVYDPLHLAKRRENDTSQS